MRRLFVFLAFTLVLGSHAFASDYDGIWFLGFNLNQPIWQKDSGKDLRRLILSQISRKEINQTLWNDSPATFPWVPFGPLQSVDSKIEITPEWKKVVQESLNPSQKTELKKLIVLHTDGPQTLIVFYQLKAQLQTLGITLVDQIVPMYPQENWEKELQKGEHHLFLMGFKAEKYPSANSLLCPILASNGVASFTGYQNPKWDEACNRPGDLTSSDIQLLNEDLPLWPLYDIERL